MKEEKNIGRKKLLWKSAFGCFCVVLDINGNKDAGWKWKKIIIGGDLQLKEIKKDKTGRWEVQIKDKLTH
jgi:hypothetical protein